MAGKRPPLPFKEIAEQALRSADTLVHRWIPGGKSRGHEYQATNPNRHDNKPGSFSINLNNGSWGDFATDDKGGDLVSLYAYLHGLEQYEAAIEVADQLAFKLPDSVEKWRAQQGDVQRKPAIIDPAAVKQKKPAKESPWVVVSPIPDDAPEPHKAHEFRGVPSRTWCYRDADGKVLGYIYRFETSDGGKETIPHVLCRTKNGKLVWRWLQWPEPRPIYGLDRLAAQPDAWVLLVEGEKCADAPVDMIKGVPVSWPGGSNGVDKVDWSPLAGKKIYAWADCDSQREKLTKAEKEAGMDPLSKPYLPEHKQPGIKAMLQIREKLLALDPATDFHLVDIPPIASKPDGWDVADAIAEGMDAQALLSFIMNTRADIPAPDQADDSAAPKQPDTPNSANAKEGGDNDWREHLNVERGKLVDCRENVFLFLNFHPRLKGLVAFDKFSLRIVKLRAAPWDHEWFDGMDWTDDDNLELGLWLSSREGFLIRGVNTLYDGVKLAASRNKFDPVIDYMNSVTWDGNHRLDTWMTDFVGVQSTEYSRLVGKLFMITIVARAFEPGCLMRTMVVFEGKQYRGKSSIFRVLGGRWFSDSPLDLKGKDGFINIQGILINEIAELGAFSNHDANVIKSYLSSATDRFRSPFDKIAKDYPRRTVMVGTTNEHEYLKDKTGNSRFWPVRTEAIGPIDLEGLAEARDQLFAEAVHLYKSGHRWHITAEQQKELFEPEQRLREHEDPWETLIAKWLDTETFNYTTVTDVMIECLKMEKSKLNTGNASSQVGKILTKLGWKQERPGASGGSKRGRVYVRPEIDDAQSPRDGGSDDHIPF